MSKEEILLQRLISGNAENEGVSYRLGDNWSYAIHNEDGTVTVESGTGDAPKHSKKTARKSTYMYWIAVIAYPQIFLNTPLLHWLDSYTGLNSLFWVGNIFTFSLLVLALSGMSKQSKQFRAAEHQVVTSLADGSMQLEKTKRSSRIHWRCGTATVTAYFLWSIIFFNVAYFATMSLTAVFSMPLVILASLAGWLLAPSIRQKTEKHERLSWLNNPGLWMQYLTTSPCEEVHLRTALSAMTFLLILPVTDETMNTLHEGKDNYGPTKALHKTVFSTNIWIEGEPFAAPPGTPSKA